MESEVKQEVQLYRESWENRTLAQGIRYWTYLVQQDIYLESLEPMFIRFTGVK